MGDRWWRDARVLDKRVVGERREEIRVLVERIRVLEVGIGVRILEIGGRVRVLIKERMVGCPWAEGVAVAVHGGKGGKGGKREDKPKGVEKREKGFRSHINRVGSGPRKHRPILFSPLSVEIFAVLPDVYVKWECQFRTQPENRPCNFGSGEPCFIFGLGSG